MKLFNRTKTTSGVQMLWENGSSFYGWNGKAYQSDIVRSCIRPASLALSKLDVKHIRETINADGRRKLEVNPEPYMRMLLQEPNPLMSMSKLLEKMGNQLKLNNNAFALIVRDANGMPMQIIPINATSAEAITDDNGEMFIRFWVPDQQYYIFRYSDIIHLRRDIYDSSLFGTSNSMALRPLMEIVTTTDQGIVSAIKNSSVVRWLLKFTTSTRPEDIEKATQNFAKQFLSVENGTGVAGVDSKAEAHQIDPKDYVPNAEQMDRTTDRLFSLFGVNKDIVQNSAGEDAMNAYYEGDVEPIIADLAAEFSRKLFTRKQRAFGNSIVFDAGMINAASFTTKLQFVAMVDRGAMSANEFRRLFNLSPVDGGDVYVRRLDTAPVDGSTGAQP